MLRRLLSRLRTPKLYFIHVTSRNIGDVLSAPYRYYPFRRHRVLDICDTDGVQSIPRNASLIVGGGGLMMPFFEPYRNALLERQPANVVWWGVGERRIQNLETRFVSRQEVTDSILPNQFPPSHLVGFRQRSADYPFLPCVSCKAVAAYRRQFPRPVIRHDVVVFEHADVPLALDGDFPKHTNHHTTADAVFSFLDSARIVVTNSYHGMYWAALLEKPVVVVPFSSGLYHHPWQVAYAHPQQVNTAIDELLRSGETPNAGMLADCVSKNDAFYSRVLNHLYS